MGLSCATAVIDTPSSAATNGHDANDDALRDEAHDEAGDGHEDEYDDGSSKSLPPPYVELVIGVIALSLDPQMNNMMEMKKNMIKQKLMGLMNSMNSMMTMKGSSMGSMDGMKVLMSSGMMGHGMGMMGGGGGCCMPMMGGD